MSERKFAQKRPGADPEGFGKDISGLSRSDFDGHTEFKKLSYRERLEWLSQTVRFSFKYSKTKKTDLE